MTKSTIYTLLEPIELPDKEAITEVDLVGSKSRNQNFGVACAKFSGFIRHSELNGLTKLNELSSLADSGKDTKPQAEPSDESLESMANGLLVRGFVSDEYFGVNLLRKFEDMRTLDKTIVSYLEKPLTDLAWAQMGWEDKQNIAASYAAFFMRK